LRFYRTPMGLRGALSGAMSIDERYHEPGGQGGSFLRNEIGRRGLAARRSVQGCFVA